MPSSVPMVSVTEPLTPALRRVRAVLFSPFDLRKWFVVGFCAWLSSCGESGGGGGGGGARGSRHGGVARDEIRGGLEAAWRYVIDNLAWILPLVLCLVVLAIMLWVLAVWLNSRGKFMFLHCVALNRAEVLAPWEANRTRATSLFWFQLILGLVACGIIAPILLGSAVIVITGLMGHGRLLGPILLASFGVLCAIAVGLVVAVIRKLTSDFVVPIMYLRTCSVRPAWRELMELASANLGRFALYLLFSVVLAMIIGMIILVVVVATCCMAGCLMAIPYFGTVLLLPVFVFKRAYSLYYLEQYGPAYRVVDQAVAT